jgi:hypothetical protein
MDQSEILRLEAAQEFALAPRTRIFFSTEGLPERAGEAFLKWGNESVRAPRQIDKDILLPSQYGQVTFHSVRAETQFLVEFNKHFYFGGTDSDRNVFLTEVTNAAYEAFAGEGEQGFYESLKPAELQGLEERHPQGVTKRQGDIFVFWCPAYGKSIEALIRALMSETKYTNEFTVRSHIGTTLAVLDTRHWIDGRSLIVDVKEDNLVRKGQYAVGTINAPNHEPLMLGKRPHRLLRAANLVRPRNGCGDR